MGTSFPHVQIPLQPGHVTSTICRDNWLGLKSLWLGFRIRAYGQGVRLLRLESPSAMCAKLRTEAASNNRDHMPWSPHYCLFAPHVYGCCSSLTSRSWWITHSTQRQWTGCNNIPSFLQRTAPISRSLCEGCTCHDFHILVTVPFCCDRKARAACAQSFVLWQQATIEITCHDHTITACSCHIYVSVVLRAHPGHGEPHVQCNGNGEVATGSTFKLRGSVFIVRV